jgi:hypothetical protein
MPLMIMPNARLPTEHAKDSILLLAEWISEQNKVSMEVTIHRQRRNERKEDSYERIQFQISNLYFERTVRTPLGIRSQEGDCGYEPYCDSG